MTFVGVMTSLRKRFGQRVKELRQASGQSQEAFADRCGFARSYMSRVERGGANPSLDAVEVLANALGVPVVALFQSGTDLHGAQPDVLMVPFASDGTCFNPSLRRAKAKTYGVGEKSRTLRFQTFEEALDYLRSMKPAKWWRPNPNCNWGLVTAVRWAPLPDKQEEATSYPTPRRSQ